MVTHFLQRNILLVDDETLMLDEMFSLSKLNCIHSLYVLRSAFPTGPPLETVYNSIIHGSPK